MRLPTRERPPALPGCQGVARVGRPTRALIPRLQPGDVAVIDHTDLDRDTARALVDAGVVAVLNAQPMISGRYPNRGPRLLAESGVLVLDGIGGAGFDSVADGRRVRICEGNVYDGELRLTGGRELGAEDLDREIEQARSGLGARLEALAHGSSALLRREEDLLLHGTGLPRPATDLADRLVLVVTEAEDTAVRLRGMRSFLVEQRPVVIAVSDGAALATAAGLRPAVVVVGPDPDEFPETAILRAAADVVLVSGGRPVDAAVEALRRLGCHPCLMETTLAPADAALLLAGGRHARLVVGVGIPMGLEDLLEHRSTGSAGAHLTRLALGSRLIDAAAVPLLYSGRVRRHHVFWALLLCLAAVILAVLVTPVGHDWAEGIWRQGQDVIDGLTAVAGGVVR